MALSIEDKKKIVSDVNELASKASSLVLADARGLNVAEANELRSEGHKSDVKFRVAKNNKTDGSNFKNTYFQKSRKVDT